MEREKCELHCSSAVRPEGWRIPPTLCLRREISGPQPPSSCWQTLTAVSRGRGAGSTVSEWADMPLTRSGRAAHTRRGRRAEGGGQGAGAAPAVRRHAPPRDLTPPGGARSSGADHSTSAVMMRPGSSRSLAALRHLAVGELGRAARWREALRARPAAALLSVRLRAFVVHSFLPPKPLFSHIPLREIWSR